MSWLCLLNSMFIFLAVSTKWKQFQASLDWLKTQGFLWFQHNSLLTTDNLKEGGLVGKRNYNLQCTSHTKLPWCLLMYSGNHKANVVKYKFHGHSGQGFHKSLHMLIFTNSDIGVVLFSLEVNQITSQFELPFNGLVYLNR